ncbi:MAG: Maf family protein [Christensenellaceae bacterium]|jgi:septum formation protein|nr:Maf family protein [Christensenellaceae bacterium]
MRILLASQSPRRRELLKTIFERFDVCVTEVDENYAGITPEKTVEEIAHRKLLMASSLYTGYDLIIAADTLVFYNGLLLGKPKDREHAVFMLELLQSKTHSVYSGIAVQYNAQIITNTARSDVTFNALNNQQINEYINTYDLMDKAGAYAIQDGVVVQSYTGEYSNIMGLPIALLKSTLFELGFKQFAP